MDCPQCSIPLIVVERNGIELDYCISCKGIWFDAGELQLLPEALGVKAEIPDIMVYPVVRVNEKERKCPRCSKAMDKVRPEGVPVTLDRCRHGEGIWLDAGELGRMVDHHNKSDEGEGFVSFLGETFRT